MIDGLDNDSVSEQGRSRARQVLQDLRHIRLDVGPKPFQSATEVVEAEFAFRSSNQAIFGTLPVAGEQILATSALCR